MSLTINGKNTLAFFKGKGFHHRDEYDPTKIYENTSQRIDCFYYKGSSYYTKKTAPVGTLPSNTTYFGILTTGSPLVVENIINDINTINQKLVKTEKIKSVLYDMYSDDINVNRGDIDGLQGATYSSFTFDPTGAKGLTFYARIANVVYIKAYIDFTHIKQGLGNEISCSPMGKNQHSTEVNNAYIVNGVTCHVIKNSDTEYLFGVPAFFTYNVTSDSFSFKNEETNRYVYRVELVEE